METLWSSLLPSVGVLGNRELLGAEPKEATLKAKALALRVIAEEIKHGEMEPATDTLEFSIAS